MVPQSEENALKLKLTRITEQNKAKAPNENKPNYRKIFSQITEFKQKVLYLQRISIKKRRYNVQEKDSRQVA